MTDPPIADASPGRAARFSGRPNALTTHFTVKTASGVTQDALVPGAAAIGGQGDGDAEGFLHDRDPVAAAAVVEGAGAQEPAGQRLLGVKVPGRADGEAGDLLPVDVVAAADPELGMIRGGVEVRERDHVGAPGHFQAIT